MSKCLIVGGADINNYEKVRSYLTGKEFTIYCDSGLKHRDSLGIKGNLIVGDFDSHENPCEETETIVLPREKDDTDTVYAVKEAIKRGFNDFVIIGTIGGRIDHSIGNLSILYMLDSQSKKGIIIDDYSEIEIVSGEAAYISDKFKFFSLLNISGCAKNITVENAKFPLCNAEITPEYQYGVSNETLPGQDAKVTVGEGRLLLVKNFI